MELKRFKDRLEKQGVTYELFCERAYQWICVKSFVAQEKNFELVVTRAFDWNESPEGWDFWLGVASETQTTSTYLSGVEEGGDCSVQLPEGVTVTTQELMKMSEDLKKREAAVATREAELDDGLPSIPSGMTQEVFLKFVKETYDRMFAICKAKNSDYTGSAVDDPFANFTRVEALGICSTEQGFLTRMTDKMCRIASFVKQGSLKVKDESVQDTLLDLANYSILMLAYLESQKIKITKT